MIPKIIHYCWFGGKEKPKKIKRCIASWKAQLLDYKFMEWNEENFDIYSSTYVTQAYQKKKYAFVSDIARIHALQQFGGIYLDTDVMVFKRFDNLLETDHFILGFEYENWVATSFMACESKHSLLYQFEQLYQEESFINPDGSSNALTNVYRLTSLLEKNGLIRNNRKQELPGKVIIYPIAYFSPYDYANCMMEKTKNSYCAHLFFVAWLPWTARLKKTMKKLFAMAFGRKGIEKLRTVRNKMLHTSK